jgi:hypothetical protein
MPAPALYGFSNEDIDFHLLNGVVNSATSGISFDSNVVKTAIGVSQVRGESHRLYMTDQNWGGARRSAFRYQIAHYTQGGGGGLSFGAGPTGQFLEFSDIQGGRDLFAITNLSAGSTFVSDCQAMYFNGSVWVNVGAPFTVPAGVGIHTITIEMDNSVGIFTWHFNGMLVASYSGDTIWTASADMDCIRHWGWGDQGSGGHYANWYSEHIFGSSNFMTYGLHVFNPRITGASAFGAGNSQQVAGVYTDINEDTLNTATGITQDTVGQLSTFAMADMPGSISGAPIFAARVAAMARRGNTGPQTMKLALQQTAGLQLSSAKSLNGIGLITVAEQFLLDYTGVPFSPTVVNAAEGGVQAAT